MNSIRFATTRPRVSEQSLLTRFTIDVFISRERQVLVLTVFFSLSRDESLVSRDESLLSRDESLVSRDENPVSEEGGNLLLSGTVDISSYMYTELISYISEDLYVL